MYSVAIEREPEFAGIERIDLGTRRFSPGNCSFEGIVGQSRGMRKVFKTIERVADSDSTIVISGETGTGKGMVARAIHNRSYRRNKPFVQINCGAIPENLLESELFGHEKGAFTGATAAKKGKFEVADGGTIFLDEIGDMNLDLQVKLLRVLEECQFERVGSCSTINVDVRIIVATHRDLEAAVAEGRFRQDLYYRLFVIPIVLPPLRERQDDVHLLASHFIDEIRREKRSPIEGFSREALERLSRHDWPGNVRELKNMVERLVVLNDGPKIEVSDLPPSILSCSGNAANLPPLEISDEGICLSTAVNEYEKALITQSLEKSKWVKKKAAELLHVKRTTLVEKIKRHQLQPAT